jgi:hypothetical protein
MSLYAHIIGGVVAEALFTPPAGFTIGECFAPALLWVDVTGVTPEPQPGWLATQTGGVWTFAAPAAPTAPAPTLAEQAAALLAGGLTITSTSTPAISATYAATPAATSNIMAEMIAILALGTFADGGSTLVWPDINFVNRTFPSLVAFRGFAVAVGAFVADCAKATNGAATALPSANVTIP